MSNDIAPFAASAWMLARRSFEGGVVPLPFMRDIKLLECHVAGTSFVENILDLEGELMPSEGLILMREPRNCHDSLAILVMDRKGNKLGYIPREKNEVPARLMDAGKHLFGRLESVAWWNESYLRIEITVFMRDI
ncbi:MAG: HIRAN domain-containing protein [Candidatus Eremiobacteraeota bacterium]|nr:HIRAN domain-containing protein [Candidatus Eremiobacteraeota bacterium]